MGPPNKQHEAAFLSYTGKRIGDLNDEQRHVTLMVAEIHIKPFFDYKGENIASGTANSACAVV